MSRYRRRSGLSLFGLIYLIIGVVVAVTHNYFDHLHSLARVVDLVLAVFLWPLVLAGIHMHI